MRACGSKPEFWLERARAIEGNIKALITENPLVFFASICQAFIDDTALDSLRARRDLDATVEKMARRKHRLASLYNHLYSITGVGDELKEMESIMLLGYDVTRALEDICCHAILGEDELIEKYKKGDMLFQKIWELVYD